MAKAKKSQLGETHVGMRMPASLKKRLAKAAKDRGIGPSTLLRMILIEYLGSRNE